MIQIVSSFGCFWASLFIMFHAKQVPILQWMWTCNCFFLTLSAIIFSISEVNNPSLKLLFQRTMFGISALGWCLHWLLQSTDVFLTLFNAAFTWMTLQFWMLHSPHYQLFCTDLSENVELFVSEQKEFILQNVNGLLASFGCTSFVSVLLLGKDQPLSMLPLFVLFSLMFGEFVTWRNMTKLIEQESLFLLQCLLYILVRLLHLTFMTMSVQTDHIGFVWIQILLTHDFISLFLLILCVKFTRELVCVPKIALTSVPQHAVQNDICSICLDELSNGAASKLNSCNHTFHDHCILKACFVHHQHTCPLCRADILLKVEFV